MATARPIPESPHRPRPQELSLRRLGAGGTAAAIAYTLIETAKLNGVDPHAWLADTLARISDYKVTKVDEGFRHRPPDWHGRHELNREGRARAAPHVETR